MYVSWSNVFFTIIGKEFQRMSPFVLIPWSEKVFVLFENRQCVLLCNYKF